MLRPIDTRPGEAFVPAPITDEEAAAAFRTVVNIFAKWNLTDRQSATLLDLPPRSFSRWKTTGTTGTWSRDLKARLSNILGIHKALRYLFRDLDRVYAWVHKPNAAFGGSSALAVMENGELTDLMRVRRYLDAERGAW